MSGFLLLFPFYVTDIAGMQIAQVVHSIIAVLFVALILGHIYIGTLGMEGAFEAMGTGEVDFNWAKEHHDLWLQDELAKGTTGPRGCRRLQPPSDVRRGADPAFDLQWRSPPEIGDRTSQPNLIVGAPAHAAAVVMPAKAGIQYAPASRSVRRLLDSGSRFPAFARPE